MNAHDLELFAAVRLVVAAFDDLGVPYFVGGSIASMVFGEPLELYLATPEDTVLAKLDWFRKGGEVSDRQWRDVLGVLKVQAEALDCAYLREWAALLGLTDLLWRALDDAGLPSET